MIDKSDFNTAQPGSYYTIGASSEGGYVFMLHGSSRNAEWMEKPARRVSESLPSHQIIVPNGFTDNSHPDVSGYRHAKEVGKKFDWQFFSDDQAQLYNENLQDVNPFYIHHKQRPQNKAVHLFGFSAGALGTLEELSNNPQLYSSLTMVGYHIDPYHVDRLCAKAAENPHITQKPILIIMGRLDPLSLFNEHAVISEKIKNLNKQGRLTGFAGRHQDQQEHQQSIEKLRQAGFTVEEEFPKLTAHNLSAAVTKKYARFIDKHFPAPAPVTAPEPPEC